MIEAVARTAIKVGIPM